MYFVCDHIFNILAKQISRKYEILKSKGKQPATPCFTFLWKIIQFDFEKFLVSPPNCILGVFIFEIISTNLIKIVKTF